jgi:hypothetical protein
MAISKADHYFVIYFCGLFSHNNWLSILILGYSKALLYIVNPNFGIVSTLCSSMIW